jgi:hypothetical protein
VDVMGIDANLLAEQGAEARRVERRAGAEDAARRRAQRPQPCARSECVVMSTGLVATINLARPARVPRCRHDLSKNGGVAFEQLQPCLARFLVDARRDHHARQPARSA